MSAELRQTNERSEEALRKLQADFAVFKARQPQSPPVATPDQILGQLMPYIEQHTDNSLGTMFRGLETTLHDRIDQHKWALDKAVNEKLASMLEVVPPMKAWISEFTEAAERIEERKFD